VGIVCLLAPGSVSQLFTGKTGTTTVNDKKQIAFRHL